MSENDDFCVEEMMKEKPFFHMLKHPRVCSIYIREVLYQIMIDRSGSGIQNVDVMGELVKHLLRAWYQIEDEITSMETFKEYIDRLQSSTPKAKTGVDK